MRKLRSGGGWPAIRYVLKTARRAGGIVRTFRAMRTRNACKTCALGMGGQRGGMVNEAGRFPEFCKKSVQAMAADMQPGIAPEFFVSHPVERLRGLSPRELEASGRLVDPVLLERGSPGYRVIGWEEALARIADRLRACPPERSFFYFSGRSSNEAGFLLQLFARVYGTNHVNNCSYYCHQASGVGLTSSIGTGTATLTLDDLEQADLVFLLGANPPSNHPRLMTTLMHLRRRGGKVVVVNPVVETGLVKFRVPSNPRSLLFGTGIATTWVQPHVGGDLALLAGIAKATDVLGATDAAFVRDHAEGYAEWIAAVRATPFEEIEAKSGVGRSAIEDVAATYAAAKNAVFAWTMGITHHEHGVRNVQAIANLALMRGMVGRPHAGLMPIRGHSNVQGIGSVGGTPQLKGAIAEGIERRFGIVLPTRPGFDTLACVEAAHAGEMDVGFCLGGNLYGSNPDSAFAEEALGRLDLLVHLSTTLNTGHARGLARETIVLPVRARDEEPRPTTQESMFNYVRLSDGGPARHDGPRSEIEVVAGIAERVLGTGGPVDWAALRDADRIRETIAAVVPGYGPVGRIGETKEEFQIEGRTFHEPRFPLPGGKARFHVHELPALRGTGPGEVRLMTVRSEGQFNTVVYDEEDLYRGQERRDVILLHPDDLDRLGLRPDQAVRVASDTGALDGILARPFPSIRPGNALMYYPEANVLVSRRRDPLSRTPAFKGVVVTMAASGSTIPGWS